MGCGVSNPSGSSVHPSVGNSHFDPPDSRRLDAMLTWTAEGENHHDPHHDQSKERKPPPTIDEFVKLLRWNTDIRLHKLRHRWIPLHLLCQARSEVLTLPLLVLFLSRAKSEQLAARHYTGETAIHWLASHWSRPAGSFELLLRGDPNAANDSNSFSSTAIHQWASNSSVAPTLAEAKLVVKLAKSALLRKGHNDYIPLHCYCSLPTVDDAVLRTLIDACPESVHALANGCIPLSMRSFSAHDLSGFSTLIHLATDDELRSISGNGKSLLHFMVETSHTLTTARMELLLQRVPDLASIPSLGMLPLHALMRNQYATLELCLFLLRAYPQAAQSELPPNTLPLLRQFLLFQRSTQLSTDEHDAMLCAALELLLPSSADAVRAVTADSTVVHAYLCTNHRSMRVLSQLLGVDSSMESLSSDAVALLSACDDQGRTPLLALVAAGPTFRHPPLSIREAMWFARAPELFAAVDATGCSLLHYLCAFFPDVDVELLGLVLELTPERVACSRTGSLTPEAIGAGITVAHMMARRNARAQNLEVLLRCRPALASIPDSQGRLPLHILSACHNLIHSQLLPLMSPELVRVRDADGLTFVDVLRRDCSPCALLSKVLLDVLVWAAATLLTDEVAVEWWAKETWTVSDIMTSLPQVVVAADRSAPCLQFLRRIGFFYGRHSNVDPTRTDTDAADNYNIALLKKVWPEGAKAFSDSWHAGVKPRQDSRETRRDELISVIERVTLDI